MEISVVTIFPGMFDPVLVHGMVRAAVEGGALTVSFEDPRDYADNRYRSVDDRPYGGGPGMVMSPLPLGRAIDQARNRAGGQVVYLSPQGERFDQALAREMAQWDAMTLVCGRYEGIDERIVESRVDREVSVGDFVVAGGELPAMLVIDAVSRLLPGVLGNSESAIEESFSAGMLDYPQYTRPEEFEGRRVPEVLLSGDHARIRRWRAEQARARTLKRRPDLLDDAGD